MSRLHSVLCGSDRMLWGLALCQGEFVLCALVTQPPPPSIVIAVQVRRLRDERGWSARELGERMAAEGATWDRSVVANLESGRRRSVSVEEWLTLARVLDVAPIHLLVPLADDREYAVTPRQTSTADQVRAWVRGYASAISRSPAFVQHRPADERDAVDEELAKLDEMADALLVHTEFALKIAKRAREVLTKRVGPQRARTAAETRERARAQLGEHRRREGRA